MNTMINFCTRVIENHLKARSVTVRNNCVSFLVPKSAVGAQFFTSAPDTFEFAINDGRFIGLALKEEDRGFVFLIYRVNND